MSCKNRPRVKLSDRAIGFVYLNVRAIYHISHSISDNNFRQPVLLHSSHDRFIEDVNNISGANKVNEASRMTRPHTKTERLV
jgi:hypothetical protein